MNGPAKMIRTLAALAGLALAAAPAAAGAAAAGCVGCHKTVSARKNGHGPAVAGMCSVCHAGEKPDPVKHHLFTLAKPEPELCLSCHDTMRRKVESSKTPHPAIDAGGCTVCHDPHGAEQRFFLKDKSMDRLCSSCHERKMKGAVAHKPAQGSCALCHDPHGSQEPKLLKTAPPGLCLDCHQKSRAEFARKHVHGPVQTGCPTCHDPHSAPRKSLLKHDAKKDLCLSCHADMAKRLAALKRPHPAIEAAGCIGCHTPHASDQPRLLRGPMTQLCARCHKEKAAELKSSFLHGPVALGQCQGCHDPHGADNPGILKAYFPAEFYNSYQDGLYALCFNCHEKDIAREKKTTKLTNFRNGDLNLHYIHVHSEKGRSCKACHAVHAGNQDKHVRESVPFGTWALPVKFTKTSGGGTCITGCHEQRAYERGKGTAKP